MQRRAESVEARQAELAIDHRFVREAAARPAILFRHGGAEESGGARGGPDLTVIDPGLVPALEMGPELRRHETPRLLFEQDQVFAHPGRAWQVENVHGDSARPTIPARAGQGESRR
jgi:hypothetical protein